MKLKNSTIVQAILTLRNLPTLKQSPKGVHALARSKVRLDAELAVIEETSKAAFKDAFGEDAKEVQQNHPGVPGWQAAQKRIDDTEVEVDVHQCTLADLNLDKNDLSPAQLGSIAFIISDF